MKFQFGFLFLIISIQSLAALPPKYQNDKDLNVMVNFIKEHPKVISTLKKIDLESKKVFFDKDCIARFGRKQMKRAVGWVGPAPALEYKKSNCEIN